MAPQTFDPASFFPFIAILAPIAMFWTQVKTFLVKVLNIFVVSVRINGHAAYAVNYNVSANYKRYSMGSYNYSAHTFYVNTVNRRMPVLIELLAKIPQLIYAKGLFVLKNVQQEHDDSSMVSAVSMFYLRGTFNHEAFMVESMNRYNDSLTSKWNKSRFSISYKKGLGKRTIIQSSTNNDDAPFANNINKTSEAEGEQIIASTNRLVTFKIGEIGFSNANGELKSYVFCDQAKSLLAECQRWKDSEAWYRSRGILWRRGALLIGKPGSGKTSLIRNICKILDLPLFIFDLASMSNSEMIDAWDSVQVSSPCAVLFDDIEKTFVNGVNVIGEDGGGLSYDCFLSCLSGAKPAEGILTFCTTNDPTKLNDTLGVSQNGIVSRPGRIDSIIEINNMVEGNRRELAKNILGEFNLDLEAIVAKGDGMTGAQFGDLCTTLALAEYWKQHG